MRAQYPDVCAHSREVMTAFHHLNTRLLPLMIIIMMMMGCLIVDGSKCLVSVIVIVYLAGISPVVADQIHKHVSYIPIYSTAIIMLCQIH